MAIRIAGIALATVVLAIFALVFMGSQVKQTTGLNCPASSPGSDVYALCYPNGKP
jgi:hypothetical protein